MKQTNVYLLDDHKIVRDGLKSILSMHTEYQVVGEESRPDVFLSTLSDLDIDILILDVSLPNISGIDLIKKIKEVKSSLQIVMLSMHENPEYMFRSLKEGANAYLPKDIEAGEFIEALDQVRLRGSYFPSNMNFNNKDTLTPPPEGLKYSILLTSRELEILSYMAKGLSSKQIAQQITVSPRTVETHRVNIMKKLGTNNGAETVALAWKLKLIQDDKI